MPDQEADEDVVSDPELITRVRAGDRSAFGELYRRHSGPATTLSRQFARSAAESDDLVSESFARVLDNLLSGKGPDTAFRAYLFTTIRNTAYDRTRKDKKLQFTDDMTTHDVAVVGDDPVLAKMESGLVATAFAQLPERWQAVLWHTQVEGESPAKVGAMLGMAPGAVSSLAFRAREGLREAYLQAHLAETAAEQCRKTVENLGAWTRGGLSKREKAQVDAHLETCDRCRALAAELEEVNSGLRGLLAPLLLGGAAAGYLATLGPVAPLAAPGTLVAGAGAAGAAGSSGGSTAGGGTTAGAGAGTSGGAAGTGAAAGAAGGSAAATTGAAAVAAGAAAVAAGAVGAAAYASSQAGSSAAGGSAGGAAGGAAAGGAAAGAGGAAAGGLAGVIASMGVGGLVAAGAAVLVAAVAAVVFVVSGNSPETTTAADQQGASSQSAAGSTDDPAAGVGSGASGAAGSGAAASGAAASGAGSAGLAADSPAPGTAATVGADAAGTDGLATDEVLPVLATTADSVASTVDSVASTADSVASTADPGAPPAVPATNTPAETPATATSATDTSATEIPATSSQPDTSSTSTSPPVTPFNLEVSGFTAPALTAGGTGSATATIANTGDQVAPSQPLTVTVPTGVQVTGVDVAPGGPALRRAALRLAPLPCAPADALTCTSDLPEIAGHSSLVVTVSLSAVPTAADGSVSIQIGALEAQSTPITVDSPVTSLTVDPTDPLIAGSINTRTLTVGTATGIADPGTITFTSLDPDVTFGGSAGCDPPTGGSTLTCTGSSITLSISIADELFSGLLPMAVTDAGGRALSLPLDVVTPAVLQLSELTISEPLIAGGGGQLMLTVDNTGGSPSSTEAIDISLPDGIKVTGVTAGTSLICTTAAGCQLPELAAGQSLPLLFDLQVCRCVIAKPFPPAAVTIAGQPATRQLTVGSGIAALTTVPDGPFVAGSSNAVTITATKVDGVSNAGKVTFTSTSRHVTFSDAKNCEKVKPPGAGVSAIRCDGTSFPMTIVIAKDLRPGVLPVIATDAGGRRLALLDADQAPLQVVAPARLQPGDFTVTRPVRAGDYGLLTLTVTNPNPEPSSRMSFAITLDNGLQLINVDGLGRGKLSGLCGPFWGRTCHLPAVGTDPLTLTFAVSAPRTAGSSGTLTVTIDHTARSKTFAVSPALQTDALGLTLGLPKESVESSAASSAGRDQGIDDELTPMPEATGPSGPSQTPAVDSSRPASSAPEPTTSGAESAPPTGSTDAAPATTTTPITASTTAASTTAASTTAPSTTAPSTDLALVSPPETSAADGTTPAIPPPSSSAAPTPVESAASRPAATDPAEVLLSAPTGGAALAPSGSSELGFTARNTGGERSAATPIRITLPDGFEVDSVTVGGSTICTAGDECVLAALNPGDEVPVTIGVRAGPGARGGPVMITVDGSGVGWRLALRSPTPVTPSTPVSTNANTLATPDPVPTDGNR